MEVAEQTSTLGFQELQHFQEVQPIEHKLHLTRGDIPWLPKGTEQENINLVRVRLKGGGEFYFGNLIRGDLVEAAESLDSNGLNQSQIANNMLYSRLPTFITQGYHPGIRPVDNAKTTRPMYEAGNKSGQRVFFVEFPRFDKLQDNRVIIRVAVCDKNKEGIVLRTITTSSKKRIKQTAKL